MEGVLWYVLTGSRGGKNRVRILRALDRQPRNANELAEALDLNYSTVTHHLEKLEEHDVVENHGEDYGVIYMPTDKVRANWDIVEEIMKNLTEEP